MRDSQLSPQALNPPATTPPPLRNRNSTPSISPLSTTSKTHIDLPAATEPQQQHDTNDLDDDGSSSLSEYDAEFDDAKDQDSEAETERLEHSPQKPWKVTDITRTPSKLNQATILSNDHSSPVRQPQSPSPSHGLVIMSQTSNTPPALTRHSASPASVAGKKRKRPSPVVNDVEKTPKRQSPVVSDVDSPLSEHSDSEEPLPANGNIEKAQASARQTPEVRQIDENPYMSPMKAARLKRAKQKASPAPQKPEVEVDEEDIDELHNDDEQDRENKKRATEAFGAIAEQFQTFRTKLHDERVAAAEFELEQLKYSHPTHPDYLGMLQCITARRDTKIQQEMRLHQYKLGSLRNQTLAERAQLHSQFIQEGREMRDSMLSELGKQWYDIQKERRQWQADQQDNYSYKFPARRSDQVRHQEKYNREVSILAGMAKYRGFPAAPEIQGARPTELDQDFKAMNMQPPKPFLYQNNTHVHTQQQPPPARTAEEKFIEQTPWANPQHPFHLQTRTPGPFATYGVHMQAANTPAAHMQSANSSAVNLLRQTSQRTNSPFSTPLNPQKRPEYHTNGLGSNDTIGIPSDPPSSINQMPPTVERFPHVLAGDISPTDHLKVRPAVSNPLSNREDRRNFSGLSSASTIETPSDPAETDRPHHHYPGLGQNGMPPSLPLDTSAPHQPFITSAMHTQNPKTDERKPDLYENFRRPPLSAFGTPLPIFGGASPARQDGQKAS